MFSCLLLYFLEVTTFSWHFQIILKVFLFNCFTVSLLLLRLWFRYCLSYTPLTPLIENEEIRERIIKREYLIWFEYRLPLQSPHNFRYNIKYKKKNLNYQMWIKKSKWKLRVFIHSKKSLYITHQNSLKMVFFTPKT